MSRREASLTLEDGARFEGLALGAGGSAQGEVVFHTAMAGYAETLTDPSYKGQILVFAYPLQGNYGVQGEAREADRIQVAGVIMACCAGPQAHPGAPVDLAAWLTAEKIPAMSSACTRSLIAHLRNAGPMKGELDASRADPARGGPKVLVIDTGAKSSLLEALVSRGAVPIRVDPASAWEDLLPEAGGILLPNGPGDPRDYGPLVERLKPLLTMDLPILGICLGHQLLALAAGARIDRLEVGHRSHNHPVLDPVRKLAAITSQNHGYAVDAASLDSDWFPRFVNLLDGTVEGLGHRRRPFFTAQFHPEGAAGPKDAAYLFDEFLLAVRSLTGGR